MKFTVDDKIIFAFSSRALLSLEAEDQIFHTQGEEAYRAHQWAHRHNRLKAGLALPLARKLLAINPSLDERYVEAVVISRNDPISGLRIFNSLAKHGLHEICAGAMTNGRDPIPQLHAFKSTLFLSADEADVRRALNAGLAAALVMPHLNQPRRAKNEDKEIRIAFDFDGVVADDASERVTATHGLSAFKQNERKKRRTPLGSGPFRNVLAAFHYLKETGAPIRTALITARVESPAIERAMTTLQHWGLPVDEAIYTGSEPKTEFIRAFDPDIYFDDTTHHAMRAAPYVLSGHVVHGIKNTPA